MSGQYFPVLRPAAALALMVLVAGCASPSPEFFGAERASIVQDGTRVEVFWTQRRAQAIRMDYANRAQQRDMPATLVRAIEAATGCAVPRGSTKGDSGVITASLNCAGG